jgi:3-methyladenine DNA glycosylase AlkD
MPMTPDEYVGIAKRALLAHANHKLAVQMKAYLRGQFDFLGIQTPTRRLICKDLPRLPADPALLLQVAEMLWKQPEREYRYVACDLLKKNAKLFQIRDLSALKRMLQTNAWWETVDSLSGVVGDIVLQEKLQGIDAQDIMDKWVEDEDFWVRRSAMIHQLGWRLNTDTNRLSKYALRLSSESEFFIRKAIGWALRDYAKWDPAYVIGFVNQNRTVFSSLTVREATKNFVLK